MNIFDYCLNKENNEEFLTEIFKNNNVKIERIVSFGQTTDWYDQDDFEFVILLSGEAILEFENGDKINLDRGNYLIIEPHKKHKVIYTSKSEDCIWLCFFFKQN